MENIKKIVLALLVVALIAVAAVAGTFAYLTDTDSADNVMTLGKVKIKLVENYTQDSKLLPGVDVNKDVQIKNTGDTDAWVWYTYAIPAALDNDDASKNVLHVNHAGRNWLGYQDNQKYWADGQTEATPVYECWMVDKYVTKNVNIDGVIYNVYAVLYNGPLAAGDTTTIGLTKVYLDTKVDYNETDGYIIVKDGVVTPTGLNADEVKIIVTAYAIQADGFTNVIDAYAAYAGQWGLTVPTNP